MMLVLKQDATNNFARMMYVDLLPVVIQTGQDYQYSSFVMTIPVFGFSVKVTNNCHWKRPFLS